MLATVFFTRRQKQTKVEFLLAGRTAPWILTAFSMAATWVWAPSMFTAAEKAYTQGLAGVFWFVVPNVLTLVLFAFFANKMRQIRPFGWTFSDYIRETYQKIYQILIAGDPKRRSYRVVKADLIRDMQRSKPN